MTCALACVIFFVSLFKGQLIVEKAGVRYNAQGSVVGY